MNKSIGPKVVSCVNLTAVNPEVLLQMVFVLEGLAALRAFKLAVSGCLVEQLVLHGTTDRGTILNTIFYFILLKKRRCTNMARVTVQEIFTIGRHDNRPTRRLGFLFPPRQ